VSEDKESVVRPFARALEAAGIPFWLDEAEILWGDNIVMTINDGLKISDYVVCFLSDAWVDRGWPEGEMSAAMAAEFSNGAKRVLPMMVSDGSKVLEEYPILKGKAYLKWGDGIDPAVEQIQALLERRDQKAAPTDS